MIGKDENEIESCIIEAKQDTINDYMYKLGIISQNVKVNRNLINDRLQSSVESTVTSLASSISMLERSIEELSNKKVKAKTTTFNMHPIFEQALKPLVSGSTV